MVQLSGITQKRRNGARNESGGLGGKWRVVEGIFSRSFIKITQHIPSTLSIPSIPSTLSKEK
jgi:hypothetical protein